MAFIQFAGMSEHTWSPTEIFEIIKFYETNAFLWDKTQWEYKNKKLKAEKLNDISVAMNIPTQEIIRKLHNLRNQFCEEIRRGRKKRRFKNGEMPDSSWRYFSAMKFLIPTIKIRSKIRKKIYGRTEVVKNEESQEEDTDGSLESDDREEIHPQKIPAKFLSNNCNERSKRYSLRFLPKTVLYEERNSIEYEEFNRNEERCKMKIPAKFLNNTHDKESKHSLRLLAKSPEEEMHTMEYEELDGTEEKCKKRISARYSNSAYDEQPKHSLRFLPKRLDEKRNNVEHWRTEEKCEKIPTRFLNNNYDEEPRHSLRVLPNVPDEDDRFGEYVALELRSLRSETSKRRLKSEIRKAICRIADLDDADLLIPTTPPEFLTVYSPASPKYSQICEITNVTSEST